jgi:competence protein ComEC
LPSALIHVLNVEHGDSIVLRIDSASGQKWVLVDSNTVGTGNERVCPARELLKYNGVTDLDLVVITHLHADHYAGMDLILEDFDVKKLAIPPFVSQKSKSYSEV